MEEYKKIFEIEYHGDIELSPTHLFYALTQSMRGLHTDKMEIREIKKEDNV